MLLNFKLKKHIPHLFFLESLGSKMEEDYKDKGLWPGSNYVR